MNKRIRELAEQAGYKADMFGIGHWDMQECQNFAELIVQECKENFSKVWYEQGGVRGAEIGKFLTQFDEHLGVKK